MYLMNPNELQDIIDLLDHSEKENHTSTLQTSCDSNLYNEENLIRNIPVPVLNTENNWINIKNKWMCISSPTAIRTLEHTSNVLPALERIEVREEDEDVVFVSEFKSINKQAWNNNLVTTPTYTCQCIECKYNQSGTWFYCKSCSFQASDSRCLNEHAASIHNREKKFACYFCSYRAEYKKGLMKHMKIHDKKLIFQCKVCDYKTENRHDYTGHLKSHSTKKYLKCPECEYRTTHKGSLKIHITIHSEEKHYECYECGHKTATRRAMVGHVQTHSSKKLYKCKDCNYESKGKRYMNRHLEIFKHTRDRSAEELRCDKCNYVTFNDRSLQWHLRVHTDERLFECFLCEYKTNCSSNFRKHELLHANKNKV
ncbi:hypothetical protein ILUMI_24705 [Ignelater luminosus]|uniref:C2H2-type domain-containing protein n=1 Tax=Ignelater luminosus TaxID=2038154 RepID=A0A8K0C6N7_IGNLU|nr:hypothetical protein ILUMI_24705 [Ignelater luminosus]